MEILPGDREGLTILETVVREIAEALGVDSPVPPSQAAPKR